MSKVPNKEIVTEWIKVPSTSDIKFVGKEVVCLACDSYLLFYSLTTGQEHVHFASGEEYGDGVQCHAGHRQIAVTAFAEKCFNPRIIIINYPDFNIIRILEDGAPEGYMALAFSDQDFLISLSNLPEFEFTVWNWRTQEKLYSKISKIRKLNQILSCSYHSPLSVIQYYKFAKRISLWDVHNFQKHCSTLRHEIDIPHDDVIVDAVWNTEGALFILNDRACIYMLNQQYEFEIVIYGPGLGQNIPCFSWYKGGLLVVLPNYDIKHFKRVGNWVENWSVTPAKITKLIPSFGRDFLVGWSSDGEITELDYNKFIFNIKKKYKSNFKSVCIINPTCNYFTTLSTSNNIDVWDCFTGEQVAHLNFSEKINVIVTNPEYPYIAVGFYSGFLKIISVFIPTEPIIMKSFYLYREEINKIVFNEEGNIMVAANLKYGLFFVIKGIHDLEIVTYIDYRRVTMDVCVTEDEKYYRVYILTQPEESVHQSIVMKTISKLNNKIKKNKFADAKYTYSHLTLAENGFCARQIHSRRIDLIQLQKKRVKIEADLNSGHILRKFNLESNKHHVYTFGYDGLIIVRTRSVNEVLEIINPHHRINGGVSMVAVDPMLRYIISLGKSNALVCTKITKSKVEDKKLRESARRLLEYAPMFAPSALAIMQDSVEDEEYTFIEKFERMQLIKETEIHAKERENIMHEFENLKKEVIQLFEANINGPELEKIDVLEFYLHTKLREYKEKLCIEECEWTVKYYNELMRSQNELWLKMKERFWDTMIVKRSIIKGILSNFSVENYTVVPEHLDIAKLKYAEAVREFEEMLRTADFFRPWCPANDNVIKTQLDRPPGITLIDESARIMEALEEDVESGSEENIENNVENYLGTMSREFITLNPYLYMQEEIHTYIQIITHRYIMHFDAHKLREFFNAKYNHIMQLKVREMNQTIEKNNRLRFILSELKFTDIEIEDPEWLPAEIPESIIKVEPHEIGITPYISPSQQARLDWEAAEAERIRLLLLADDFRERALMKMMDGVLEVRWEDTLKRDIPKPKCMLEKEPETWNEEDLRAVRDYDEAVAFLNSERIRYKNMLEQEYAKIADTIRESVKKFNIRLRELLLTKIRVESARSQQTLLLQRLQLFTQKRLVMMDQEEQIKENIKKAEKNVVWVQNKILKLNELLNECKLSNEVLITKEKTLEKNLKKDFQEYSALIQEQIMKLYKKHPKAQVRGVNTATLLNELGNCIVSQEKSPLLTYECFEYIKSVDNLDQYVGVPNTIDETMYKILCRHRRLKLDNELKMKAQGMELAEFEAGVQIYQKYLTASKEKCTKLISDLAKHRNNKLDFIHNKELQIVMRKGYVEVPLLGYISDYKDAILVNKEDVEGINEIILKAGNRKLKVMRDKMIHRRLILMKEWEHRKMKMEIEDLKDYLDMIKHVKVTKEIQLYLKQKARGGTLESGMLTLDQEIEHRKKSYEKMITERHNAIDELDSQIREYKRKNKTLDQQIAEVNVDVCEQHLARDVEFERKHEEMIKKRMTAIVKRSSLVKKIQEQHNEILVLQAELELLRLKTYPTLKFKTLY